MLLHFKIFSADDSLLKLLDFFVEKGPLFEKKVAQSFSLIRFVNSEFSRRYMFQGMKVSRRRFVVRAFASFLEGKIWAVTQSPAPEDGLQYLIQDNLDYFETPYRFPILETEDIFRAQFSGRIFLALQKRKKNLSSRFSKYLGTKDHSFGALISEFSFIPGIFTNQFEVPPVEGLDETIRSTLTARIDAHSFQCLGEWITWSAAKNEHAILATRALENIRGQNLPFETLSTLAIVAAQTRHIQLAETVFLNFRNVLLEFEPVKVIHLIMILAAARNQRKDWREAMGEMMRVYAFADISVQHSKALPYLERIIDIDTVFSRTLSDAITALKLVAQNRG